MDSRMPRLLPPLAAALALLLGAGAAHADATLDKIKQRGKLSVGIDGASPPFGVLDPRPPTRPSSVTLGPCSLRMACMGGF